LLAVKPIRRLKPLSHRWYGEAGHELRIASLLWLLLGTLVGVTDATVQPWDVKAFLWLIYAVIMTWWLGYELIWYQRPLRTELVNTGFLACAQGGLVFVWSINWWTVWHMLGRTVADPMWVIPNLWIPVWFYWLCNILSLIGLLLGLCVVWRFGREFGEK